MLGKLYLTKVAAPLLFAACVVFPTVSSACPDYNQYGARYDLTGRELASSRSYSVVAGGRSSLTYCGTVNETGYVTEAPDFSFNLTGMAGYQLDLSVRSECDAVLLVNDPNAAWFYDDDSNGAQDPKIRLNVSNGWTDVWVGTYDGNNCNATLTVEAISFGGQGPDRYEHRHDDQRPWQDRRPERRDHGSSSVAQILEGCWAREYSADHLRSNPQQVVDTIWMNFSDDVGPDRMSANMSVFTSDSRSLRRFGLDRRRFSQGFFCDGVSEGANCYADGDSGGFFIATLQRDMIEIDTSYLAAWGRNDYVDLAENTGRATRYRLFRAGESACRGH